MELSTAYANKVTGLSALITAFGKTVPFVGGNLLLGGSGRDILKGWAGDDLIDGDRWLDVQLRAQLNDGTVKLVWDPRDLIDDVFSDPQRLNPGNITIVRTIRVGNPAVDTAQFQGPLSEYSIVGAMPGPVTVSHDGGPAAPSVLNDGTDTLLNVELLQFADQTIITPGAQVVTVPNVNGLTQAAATTAITNVALRGVRLTVGTVTTAFSATVPAGRVISSDPAGGTVVLPGSAVNLVISLGAQDVIAPVVNITAPANGATVSGTVNVTATATDAVGVVGVQFTLDGSPLGAEDTTAPYSVAWNALTAANGTHVLSARARDAAGNVGNAPLITVNVINDVTAPTVSITSPANGATVSGTITVTATAADNVGVAGVQFLLDGVALGAEDTTAPYSVAWNTTTATAGTHVLSARARDAAGNIGVAANVTVTVNNADVTAPTVSITAPANGATVSGTINVTANAADNVGVAGVQFLLDGVALGAEDTVAPYSVAWNTTTATNATHTLSARARDAAGNIGTAANITVTVSNAVADVTPPTVSLTAPANAATVSRHDQRDGERRRQRWRRRRAVPPRRRCARCAKTRSHRTASRGTRRRPPTQVTR